MLASLLTAGDHHPRGEVNQSHAALGPVLVLAALSSGHESFDTALGQEVFVRFGNGEGGREVAFGVHPSKLWESVPNGYGKGSTRSVILWETQHFHGECVC